MTPRNTLIALLIAAPMVAAFANDGEIAKSVAMKDGTTLHVFKDGKMAMEDSFGRPSRMDPGVQMTTADGTVIAMVGDEVARLSRVLKAHYAGTLMRSRWEPAAVVKTTETRVALNDGSTLYVFQDGKMGVKDLYGKARTVPEGAVLVAQDGSKVVMGATDSWRLQNYLKPNGH